MSSLNKVKAIRTHEGGKAKFINADLQLRRSVMACMLWERQFYEDGESIADRIKSLVPQCFPEVVADIAIKAREKMHLRHVPLFIVREMARHESHRHLVGETLSRIIQRADELTEFLAIYWADGRQPLSAQVKKGLAAALKKFDQYSLAKYDRPGAVRLRDVLFLSHAKPESTEQAEMWKQLIDGMLPAPDTWEVSLSSGGDKKGHWDRLLGGNRLGGMALLRNLRNMHECGANDLLVRHALSTIKSKRILPFRFIAAAKHAPQWESEIEQAMLQCIGERPKYDGHTVLLVDVSGSMDDRLSSKSDITRLDAACGVAMLLREVCDKIDIFTFSEKLVRVPNRHGFALRDSIFNSQDHSGTPLGAAIRSIYANKNEVQRFQFYYGREMGYKGQALKPDRLIVITDEQSHDSVPDPIGKGIMINVASYQNGVGYGPWLHIDGWSESVIDYCQQFEQCSQMK